MSIINIVADTNIFLAVALNESEKVPIIEITSGALLIAPESLPFEIGNALSAMVKRRQITKQEALAAENFTHSIQVRLVPVEIQSCLQRVIKKTSMLTMPTSFAAQFHSVILYSL